MWPTDELFNINSNINIRAGFDTRYLQVSRYFDTDVLRFSILRFFDISPDLDLSLNSDSIPF